MAHPFPELDYRLRAIATTITRPAVSVAIAFAIVTLIAWAVRHARLALLVWQPGKIVVRDFEAGDDLTGITAAQLTALFRERLVSLRLQSAAPSPGAASSGSFFDAIDGGVSAKDIPGSLMRLARAAAPTHALEVEGAVRRRSTGSNTFGITVQVIQRPSQASPVIKVWGTSWEHAARLAADGATAAILPRTRLCKGPWAAWRGYAMPRELLTAYEEASENEQDRRFDDAMAQYWEALRRDPTNLTVRLHLAQLQEKAGLFLAALANYQRILAVANPAAKNLPRGMYRRAARREWDRALSLAKYRAIVLLGQELVLRQWSTTADSEKNVKRDELRKEFRELLKPVANTGRRDPAADAISKATKVVLGSPATMTPTDEEARLRDLMLWAYAAAEELKLSLPRLELRPSARPLTRRTVALTQICIRRRHELLDPNPAPLDRSLLRELDREVRWAGSHPRPWGGWWPSWLRRWQWHEHYNAACVYAISLSHSDRMRRDVARSAVKHLEKAITTRNSEFVANWRDWVITEDPDLRNLRKMPEREFWAFKTMYFPSRGPRKLRAPGPTFPHRLAESRYTHDLLVTIALRLHDLWHERARGPASSDAHSLREWCNGERAVWNLVGEVAASGHDWRIRHPLLEHVNELLAVDKEINVPFTAYEDREVTLEDVDDIGDVGDMEDKVDVAAKTERELLENFLAELAPMLGRKGDEADASAFERWVEAMDQFPTHPLRPVSHRDMAALCRQNAAVWQDLLDWVRVNPGAKSARTEAGVCAKHEAFHQQLHNAAGLWMRTAKRARQPTRRAQAGCKLRNLAGFGGDGGSRR